MPETEVQSALETTWQVVRQKAVDSNYRFTPEEVSSTMRRGATTYSLAYSGTFSFMVDMKRQAARGILSVNQAKGVLNCMLAEVRREARNAEQANQPTETIDMQGLRDLFARGAAALRRPRITLWTQETGAVVFRFMSVGQNPGSLNITSDGEYFSRRWYGRVARDGTFTRGRHLTDAVMALVRELGDNPVAAAQRYAGLTGNCCFCNLRLTDERSTETGYGPICAQHYGLPWGSRPGTEVGAHRRVALTGVNADYYSAESVFRRSQRRSVQPRTPQVAPLEGMTPLGMPVAGVSPYPDGTTVEASEIDLAAGDWPERIEVRGIAYSRVSFEMGGEDEAEVISVVYRNAIGRTLYVAND